MLLLSIRQDLGIGIYTLLFGRCHPLLLSECRSDPADSLRHPGFVDRPATEHRLLVYLRVSQINGCVYCVDKHAADAAAGGESTARLNLVTVWQEAPCFTAEERAALGLAEAATRLSDGGDRVPDEVWDEAAAHFDEHTLAALVMAIATINAWNRIGAVTRMTPEAFKK